MEGWKLEQHMTPHELARLLRALAEQLETGGAPGFLAGFPAKAQEVELSALRAEAGFSVRLRAKADGRDRAPGVGWKPAAPPRSAARESDSLERAREKYRQLKKAMQADFKTLLRAAEAGAMPAPDVLESFLALCGSMAEMAQPVFSPRGAESRELDQANRAFVEDASALRRAVSGRDAAALAEALARLERRRTTCHAQFR